MKLEDAMGLSEQAAARAKARRPTVAARALELRAMARSGRVPTLEALRVQPRAAFGAARAGSEWKVAVRAWTRGDLDHEATQWLIEQAHGEVDIRITGVIRARSARKARRNRSHLAYRRVCRPLLAGHSVGHVDVTAGTLGAWVHRGDGRPLMLSNNHVLANSNAAKRGDDIVQPGPDDDSAGRGGVVGALERFVRLRDTRNSVDAALASVLDECAPDDLRIPEIGLVHGHYSGGIEEVAGLSVQKTGRTTGHTRGRVVAITVDLPVDYGDDDEERVLRFDKALEITSTRSTFSDGGDSGSLITDGDGWAVGLLFAGDDVATYANHVPSVLRALDVDFL